MTTLKLAFRKLTPGIVLLQWAGNLAAMLLAFAWLQIPDSHAWQFIFSMLFGVLLVFAFLWLHARTFRILRPSDTAVPLWQRLLVLLIVIVLGHLLLHGIGIGRNHETLFAGYWNSKFSASMRSFFTYQRLVQWQENIYALLQWLFAAVLLPIAFVGASTGLRDGGWRQIGRVYRRLLYWLVAVLSGFIAAHLTSALASWTPGHGAAGEIISVVVRFGFAYTLDILLWCFVLALIAVSAEGNKPNEPVPAP
jgi:hypothetical protein